MISECRGACVDADFSIIRYAQCWEDADILLEGLDIQPGDHCLSIASAGDNCMALLSKGPERLLALDLSPAQIACLELRVAAYQELRHPELLELMGVTSGLNRASLYRRCRSQLSSATRGFWDAHPDAIAGGIGNCGKFERYLALFRNRVLPLVHSRDRIAQLLESRTSERRRAFYGRHWDTLRWRCLFKLFFSRRVMGRLGRDPNFFRYVEGTVADRILERTRHGIIDLDPARNPYLQWILTGKHLTALPYALRPENFEAIRNNLRALEWRCQSVEDCLRKQPANSFDRFNLSNIFEYMPPESHHLILERLIYVGRTGGRIAYWNLLTPRRRPDYLASQLRSLDQFSYRLHQRDKTFFYGDFVLEEIV